MKVKNLRFFSEEGRDLNFKWSKENQYWEGRVWFPETSEGLYNSKAIYAAEKYYDTDKGDISFRYPISNQDLSLEVFWEENDHKNIFMYNTKFLERPVDRFLDPVVAASTNPVSINDGVGFLDGYELNEFDRVLLKDQADMKENGIYVHRPKHATQKLQRVQELSIGKTLRNNLVRVQHGVNYKNTLWRTESIYSEAIIGTDNIGWEEINEDEVTSDQFITSFLSVDRSELQEIDIINDSGIYGSERSDGLMSGNINKPFEGPLQLFLGFYGNDNDESERTLLITNKETNEILAKIYCYGASIQEDIRFTNFLDNIGKQITNSDIKLFKEFDINEAEPDFKELNPKRKELILNWSDIFPHLGSYRALIYAIRFFGYNDIRVKEFYQNIDENSLNYGKYLHSKIIDVFNSDSQEFQNLLYSAPINYDNSVYQKTNLLGLFYDLNDSSTYEFVTDEKGFPVLPYTHAEMVIKLFGLKERLEEQFLPISAMISDITGEGWYLNLYQIYNSTTDLVIDDINVGIKPKFNLTIEKNSRLSKFTINKTNTKVPFTITVNSEIDEIYHDEIRKYVVFAVNEDTNVIFNSSWENDITQPLELEITQPGNYTFFVRLIDFYNNSTLYRFDKKLNATLMNPTPSVINSGDRRYHPFIRNIDYNDLTFGVDLSSFFINYVDANSILKIGTTGTTLEPRIYIDSTINISLTDKCKLVLKNNSSFYESITFNVTQINNVNEEIDGVITSVQEVVLDNWDPIFTNDDLNNTQLYILPDSNSFLNANWSLKRINLKEVLTETEELKEELTFENIEEIEKDNYQVQFSDDYILSFDLTNLVKNTKSKYVLDLTFNDLYNNQFSVSNMNVVKILPNK